MRVGPRPPQSPAPRNAARFPAAPAPTAPPSRAHVGGRYKTSCCNKEINGLSCPYRDKCNFAHGADDRRRDPLIHAYAPKLCPHGADCVHYRANGRCRFAHTHVELRHHPAMLMRNLIDNERAKTRDGYVCTPFAKVIGARRR